MVKEISIKGYENLTNYLSTSADSAINIYFTGSKNETSVSWCPDCVNAEPCVRTAIENLEGDVAFVTVDVGDRACWKDMKNPFRSDKELNLQVIPTLIRWKSPLRLEGNQCANPDLLQMFFADDDA